MTGRQERAEGGGGEGPKQRPRGRKANATRERIREVAREFFSEHGFSNVPLREIAGAVGVDPALIIRYFGSKDGLFAESMQIREDFPRLMQQADADLGAAIVDRILAIEPKSRAYHVVMAMLRSMSSERVSPNLSSTLQDGWIAPLLEQMEGPDAELRAHLVTAFTVGLSIIHSVLRLPGITEADHKRIVEIAAPVLRSLLEGEGQKPRR